VKQHFLMMASYNRWANARLYGEVAGLSDELYRRDVGVFFKSLHGTLSHLLVTDRIWMGRFDGTGGHPDNPNAILIDDLASLHEARKAEDERIVRYVDALSENDFDRVLAYKKRDGTPQRGMIGELLAHLFNHQTHHRGQAHAALTVLGIVEPKPLDLFAMQREK